MSKEYDKGALAGMIVGGLIMLCVVLIGELTIFRSTANPSETLIRENERCLYENAKLSDANTRLLEELSETVEDWREE